jgi:hypothetical protein
MGYQRWKTGLACLACAIGGVLGACGCAEEESGARSEETTPVVVAPARVEFSPEARSDNQAVNAFVRSAMETCLSGDYEAFRALWRDPEKAFSREQYERGWKRAERIEVHAVRPMRLAADVNATPSEVLYYVHAEVKMAPDVRDGNRVVVVILEPHEGGWRLVPAPKRLVERVLGDGAAERGPGV